MFAPASSQWWAGHLPCTASQSALLLYLRQTGQAVIDNIQGIYETYLKGKAHRSCSLPKLSCFVLWWRRWYRRQSHHCRRRTRRWPGCPGPECTPCHQRRGPSRSGLQQTPPDWKGLTFDTTASSLREPKRKKCKTSGKVGRRKKNPTSTLFPACWGCGRASDRGRSKVTWAGYAFSSNTYITVVLPQFWRASWIFNVTAKLFTSTPNSALTCPQAGAVFVQAVLQVACFSRLESGHKACLTLTVVSWGVPLYILNYNNATGLFIQPPLHSGEVLRQDCHIWLCFFLAKYSQSNV